MRYRRLLSLSGIGLCAWLWYLAGQPDTKDPRDIAAANERPVTEAPLMIEQQPHAAMPTQTAHCGAIVKAHKHQLDDWIFALQSEQLEQSWAQYTHRLTLCLQGLAHDYMNYKQALTKVENTLTVHERFEALQTLQGQYFSAEVIAAWFADENRWNAQTLERWQILSDQSLSEQARGELIDAHISQLPREERETIEATQTLITLKQSWQTMNYNQLSARYGDEAAERLMHAKNTQTRWAQRVADYKQQRDAILAHDSDSTSQAKIAALEQTLFSVNEQKRLAVLLGNH
ncbi:lipase chaperone [Pseudoalteromonas sp. OOF1S-7]|uniref:lipase chaperone n=1 Tax=Pseudoalteromonas sp. OOF1S-7 TaxID=2917757 RepID=UPI001EF6E00D|nr:lipase chaperone [Pseudoalteromonas sp. OOF1S-7]MCG7537095.1 lipase chaperone [Pseudoalteromonas sp. OOF1S-7]